MKTVEEYDCSKHRIVGSPETAYSKVQYVWYIEKVGQHFEVKSVKSVLRKTLSS